MSAVEDLCRLLDLEPIEVDFFRGVSPDEDRQRVFGGQVAGQALVAAGRTVEVEHLLHSLHAYFLRPGDPAVPILYEVDRIRDGRSFTTRRVKAIQHGRAIFNLHVSFHRVEHSFEHQQSMPAAPDPDSLPTWRERWEPYKEWVGDWWDRPRPIDIRPVGIPPRPARTEAHEPAQLVWLRADGALPDDPMLHACVLTYASDMTLLDTSMLPHAHSIGEADLMMASLDHAMWFHRPFRADEWLLYEQVSPAAAGGRGFAWGHVYTSTGDLAVSMAQEGLLRDLRHR